MRRFIYTISFIMIIMVLTYTALVLVDAIKFALETLKTVSISSTGLNVSSGDMFVSLSGLLPLIPIMIIVIVVGGFIAIYLYRESR